jgi:hypothetical protein
MMPSFTKKLLLTLILLVTLPILSQEEENTISIEINHLTKKQIIELIEKNSDYHFFFLNDWLDNTPMTFSFKNKKIEEVLNAVFNESKINYYIHNHNLIILTSGSLIKKSVYDNDNVSPKNSAPIMIEPKNKIDEDFIKLGRETLEKKPTYTVSGFIKNDKNETPIQGVTIFEKEKNIYAISDKSGYFQIKLPYGKNKLETSFVGFDYNHKKIIVYNDGIINFSLSPKSEKLDEVVININKKNNIRQAIAGINQIKTQDIKNIPLVLGERDILKVAITLPSIKSAGEGAEGVNVRGGKVDQNLFLLDNGTIYNPTHFLGLFSAINPFTTNNLNIYTGNIPSEYGGKLSSVFEITTKDPNNHEFKGEASIGPVTGNLNVEIPIIKNKSGLNLGVRSTYSDWVLGLIDNKKFDNSNVSFYDVVGKYTHFFNDKNSLKLTGYHSKDKYQIASDTINKYGNTMFSLNWRHNFNEKNRGDLILSNSAYSFDIDYKTNNTKGFYLTYKINETNLKIKMKYDYSDTHKFVYGLESKLYNINPGKIIPNGNHSKVTPLDIPKERALENGLFISDEISATKKLNFNLGLRLNQYLAFGPSTQRQYEKGKPKNETTLVKSIEHKSYKVFQTYHNLSYRASSSYSFNNSLSLKASYNKAFQYVHRLNNNTTATPIDTWRLSDSNIVPQESSQFSLGLFKNIDNNDIKLSLEGYYKKYQNILDYKTGATLLLNEQVETQIIQGKGKSYGIEFLLKKDAGKLNGWLSYNYSRSLIQFDSMFEEERVNNGNFFPTNYDKPHDLNLILNYKFTKRYSLSTNFTYQTGRPITYPTGKFTYQGTEYLTYSKRNQFRIPDYFRLDIGINIEGNHKIKKFAHSFWNISVYNVLGRNNPYSVFFQTSSTGNVKAYKSSIFSHPIPTITYNFKF